MKFKVGDKVKFIKEGDFWSDKYCRLGNIYPIVGINDSILDISIKFNNGKELNVDSGYFELVQEDKPTYDDYCDGVHEELEKSQTPKYSYQTQILRSDGLLFTKDKIGDELVSDIQARMNRDRSLLRKRKDLFNK